ncbi:YgjP-like metallopeptidase domain-containing protein, partial [Streptomyces sp. NPDC047072]|uniref:YgjP-like metallopeptidase domain-containing protein n=1 Tax=Streptomyces sp. NPDC047072 TaxID=3154809 RepID=UPI0033DDC982
MRLFTRTLSTAALTASLALAPLPALADDGHGGHGGHTMPSGGPTTATLSAVSAREPAVSLIARLSGDQEVPVQGGPAVGDEDGDAVALLHELAHLLVPGHGPRFWRLLEAYPRTERAK